MGGSQTVERNYGKYVGEAKVNGEGIPIETRILRNAKLPGDELFKYPPSKVKTLWEHFL